MRESMASTTSCGALLPSRCSSAVSAMWPRVASVSASARSARAASEACSESAVASATMRARSRSFSFFASSASASSGSSPGAATASSARVDEAIARLALVRIGEVLARLDASAREARHLACARRLDAARHEQLGDDVVRQRREADAHRARQDRGQERVRLRREQDEVRARAGLLERLQQRVRGRHGELLDAPDHEHLGATLVRRIRGAREDERADLIDRDVLRLRRATADRLRGIERRAR